MMLPNVYKCRKFQAFPVVTAMSLALIMAACATVARAPVGQQHFTSPQQAVAALVTAVRDHNDAELLVILGPNAENLISSGDKVADQNGRARFLKAFAQRNSLEAEAEDRALLIIGSKDYPFPIPIVRRENVWFFDTRAGQEEILNRRIGRNELHTIKVMQAYTDAQREYASRKGDTRFAQKLASSEGQQDGLYWEAGENDEESPLGPLIARAAKEGYANSLDEESPEPFHGYYFKILKAQGEHADGGAFNYVVDGKMVLGFALVAYPAKYGASGIMTFIVNQEGVIYEKDLGKNTLAIAPAMTAFDPDSSWYRSQNPGAQQQ